MWVYIGAAPPLRRFQLRSSYYRSHTDDGDRDEDRMLYSTAVLIV